MRLLPKPYPEEAIGSVLLRGRLRMGLDLKSFLKWVFEISGRSSASLLLESDTTRVASMCGVSAHTLLDQHTVFPYATAYQKEVQVARLRSQLLDAAINKVGAVAPLVANSVHRGFRRLCPDCVAEDLDALGESYWRRSHQIATVLMCNKHDSLLVESVGCPAATVSAQCLVLPHYVGNTRRTRIGLSMEVARELSRASELLLNRDRQLNGWALEGMHSEYRQSALGLGFVYPSGGLATGVVADSLARFYGSRFLDHLGCRVNPVYGNPWPSLLLRRSSYQAATVRHVLLQCFLASTSVDALAKLALSHRAYTIRDYDRLDLDLAHKLRTEIDRLRAKGSTSTATQLLAATSASGTFRHNRKRFPRSNKILESFKRSVYSDRRARSNPPLYDPGDP